MPIAKKELSSRLQSARSLNAVGALGPIGHVFRSGSTARLLLVFVEKPETPFALSDLAQLSQVPRATAQVGLRQLLHAKLITGTGHGNRTRYSYAVDREMARTVRLLVQLSRNQAEPAPEPAIPWLATAVTRRPVAEDWHPFGNREGPQVSDEETRHVLEVSPPLDEAAEPRAPFGLRTRR
jgi:hypothetical protein